MSGGSYDYAFCRIHDLARAIDEAIRERGSSLLYSDGSVDLALRRRFAAHLERVAEVAHAIEWNDSGDGARDEARLILELLGETGGKRVEDG